MSRLPSEAASRNISACNVQAMSQAGCRLMVASSAKTRRPLAPAAYEDMERALATKAAMSSEVETFASPNDRASPVLWAEGMRSDLDLLGSPAINPCLQRQPCLYLVRSGPWESASGKSISTCVKARTPWGPARTSAPDREPALPAQERSLLSARCRRRPCRSWTG